MSGATRAACVLSFPADPMRRSQVSWPLPHRNVLPARRVAIRCAGVLLAALALTCLAPPRARAAAVAELAARIEHGEGGAVRVIATVKVAAGYHVNAHRPNEEFLIPTALTLQSSDVAFEEPAYPEPKEQKF